MTCVMVAYHCGSPDNPINTFDFKWNNFISSVFNSLATLAMSYFFTVTGFLLFYSLSLKNYVLKIKKRIFSLLTPYLVWQVLIVIKTIMKGGGGRLKLLLPMCFCFKCGHQMQHYGIYMLCLFSH